MNILHLHSHDTGRHIEPYGFPVRTPALVSLADRGVVFRNAFAAAASCSASRASLQTGQYPHQNGMTGLAHRGWRLFDYDRHLVNVLRRAGYRSALIGEHHVAPDSEMIGYDEVLLDSSSREREVAETASRWLTGGPREPWLLSCGFWESHRTSFDPADQAGARNVRPFPTFPDEPSLRADAAAFRQSVERLDAGVGRVLQALEDSGQGERTLILATTDHGPGFPGWKATLTDRGLATYMIVAGPGVDQGTVVDGLVSQLDAFPTLCGAAGVEVPSWAEGRSLWPALRGGGGIDCDAVFGEANFHAAFEPQRTIRTPELRYIRRWDRRAAPVLPNIDDGPTKEWVLRQQPALVAPVARRLYDLGRDPLETCNVADDPAYAGAVRELDARLESWMRETGDPLLAGEVPVFEESVANDPDAASSRDAVAPASGYGVGGDDQR